MSSLPEQGPITYRGAPFRVERRFETHTSVVFLGDELAVKIRKPVDLGFLDYSTPELRLRASRAELKLGMRISPSVYLGTETLDEAGNLGRPGEETALLMMRLPEELVATTMLRHDSSDMALDRAGVTITELLETAPRIDAAPGKAAEKTYEAWAVGFREVRGLTVPAPVSPAELRRLRLTTDQWFDGHRDLLEERARSGRFRDGHGDLHLEHIYMTDPVQLIDPLEFSPSLRIADVGAEVGFLCMDLDHRGRARVATRLSRRIGDGLGDDSLELVLPFFKRYRAFVRGKVAWFRAEQTTGGARAGQLEKSRSYFELALSYESELVRS